MQKENILKKKKKKKKKKLTSDYTLALLDNECISHNTLYLLLLGLFVA